MILYKYIGKNTTRSQLNQDYWGTTKVEKERREGMTND